MRQRTVPAKQSGKCHNNTVTDTMATWISTYIQHKFNTFQQLKGWLIIAIESADAKLYKQPLAGWRRNSETFATYTRLLPSHLGARHYDFLFNYPTENMSNKKTADAKRMGKKRKHKQAGRKQSGRIGGIWRDKLLGGNKNPLESDNWTVFCHLTSRSFS